MEGDGFLVLVCISDMDAIGVYGDSPKDAFCCGNDAKWLFTICVYCRSFRNCLLLDSNQGAQEDRFVLFDGGSLFIICRVEVVNFYRCFIGGFICYLILSFWKCFSVKVCIFFWMRGCGFAISFCFSRCFFWDHIFGVCEGVYYLNVTAIYG